MMVMTMVMMEADDEEAGDEEADVEDDDDDDVEDIPGNGDLPTALHTINLYILQSVATSHLFIIIIHQKSIAMQSIMIFQILSLQNNSCDFSNKTHSFISDQKNQYLVLSSVAI